MGAPTNLSDPGAGEMSSAAQLHGKSIMKLNQLTRWYILTGLLYVTIGLVLYALRTVTSVRLTSFDIPVLYGAILTFIGGFGIKFLPSTLGGNPHVYSLRMALWSYWLIVSGSLIWFLWFGLIRWSESISLQTPWGQVLFLPGPLLMLVGALLTMANLWKTMKSRV